MSETPVPSQEELRRQPYFGPGKDAEHPWGVLYQGEYETLHDGTGVAVRRHARALAGTGIPVVLKSFSGTVVNERGVIEPVHVAGLPAQVAVETSALRNASVGTTVPMIKHAVVHGLEQLRSMLIPRGVAVDDPAQLLALRDAVYNATILYSVWERDRIPRELVTLMNRCGQLWVPCRQNRTALIESGVEADKVYVVPHPYDPAEPLCQLVRRKANPGRRFYSIGRWEPRKGYDQLIAAYLSAFTPEDDVSLTIKTSRAPWPEYARPADVLQLWLRDTAGRGWTRENCRIQILQDVLRPDQILKLHYDHNIYVSSSHGEAWNLGAFDAKCAGNRLVHIAWGGTSDFAAADDVAVHPLGWEHVPDSYRWGPDALWAAYDVSELAEALCTATAPTEFRREAFFAEAFSMETVGQAMLQHVLQLAEQCEPRAFEYLSGRVL